MQAPSIRQLLRHPGWIATLAVVLVVIVVFAGTCTAPDSRALPPPEPTSSTEPEPTTTTVDLSRVVLEPVPGQTTTTLVDTGDAALGGVVTGPNGAVPGATVRVQRLVGDAVQTWDVQTADDGRWALDGVPGGRMRVRAFSPPALTMTEPEIFFLAEGEPRDVQLQLRAHQGLDVRSATAPSAPTVGQQVNLVVRVLEKVVDADGVATTRPLAGITVRLQWTGWTRVDGASTTSTTAGTDDDDDGDDDGDDDAPAASSTSGTEVTGSDGVALYTFRCDREATVTATAVVGTGGNEQTIPLEVPACGPRPTTTTTTTTAPTTTSTTTEGD